MRLSFTVLSLCVAFATASPVSQPITFGSDEVYLEAISYAGTGCPAGSVAVSALQGGGGVVLDFDDRFCAAIGPHVPPSLWSKNCNVNFRLHYPQGYTFTLFKTEYIGHVELDRGIQAIEESSFWFAGAPPPPPPPYKATWTGALSTNYDITHAFDEGALVWSPCGASTTLNVNTRITLDRSGNTGGQGSICLDKIKEKVKTIISIQWKRCQYP